MNLCFFRDFLISALLSHKLAVGGQQPADSAGAGVGGLAGNDDLAVAVVEGKDPGSECVDVGPGRRRRPGERLNGGGNDEFLQSSYAGAYPVRGKRGR